MLSRLAQRLNEPSLSGVQVGSQEFFRIQAELIRKRPLLKYCYDVWYRTLLDDPVVRNAPKDAIFLELGSGGSLLQRHEPRVRTSDVLPGVADMVVDARRLPFADASVTAIFMTHVFHHIPDVKMFLHEAERVLVPNGIISMVDVAATPLARFFFDRMHPEPFDPAMRMWAFDQKDSMMDSNQALTWIVFRRDRLVFERNFPGLDVEATTFLPWISYLLSGGVTKRQLVPDWLARGVIFCDRLTRFARPIFALHWHLKLRKRSRDPGSAVGDSGQRTPAHHA